MLIWIIYQNCRVYRSILRTWTPKRKHLLLANLINISWCQFVLWDSAPFEMSHVAFVFVVIMVALVVVDAARTRVKLVYLRWRSPRWQAPLFNLNVGNARKDQCLLLISKIASQKRTCLCSKICVTHNLTRTRILAWDPMSLSWGFFSLPESAAYENWSLETWHSGLGSEAIRDSLAKSCSQLHTGSAVPHRHVPILRLS